MGREEFKKTLHIAIICGPPKDGGEVKVILPPSLPKNPQTKDNSK